MMKILVSACLLGRNCRYNSANAYDPVVWDYVNDKEVIAVCPEVLAGLGVPRVPMEIVAGRLINRDGVDIDDPVRRAVAEILDQIKEEEIECCILKSRSPTCGVRQVYDGTFSGRLVKGAGVLANALMDAGYRVMDAEELDK